MILNRLTHKIIFTLKKKNWPSMSFEDVNIRKKDEKVKYDKQQKVLKPSERSIKKAKQVIQPIKRIIPLKQIESLKEIKALEKQEKGLIQVKQSIKPLEQPKE